MHRAFLRWGAGLAALGVALGALGAHELKKLVTPETLGAFETGVRYQLYHSFALLFVAILFKRFPGKWLRMSGFLFLFGILLFCGSLYFLTLLKTQNRASDSLVGLVTPVGGICFIVGWICLLSGVSRKD